MSLNELRSLGDLTMVWDDILRDKSDVFVLSCATAEADTEFMSQLNGEVKKWNKAELNTKVLTAAQQFFSISPTLACRKMTQQFSSDTLLIIYDVQVVSITFDGKSITGAAIVDAPLSELMKNMFNYIWSLAKK